MYLALGTPVVYTQCAAVARKGHSGMALKGWHVPQKGNGFVAAHEPLGEGDHQFGYLNGYVVKMSFVKEDGEALTPEEIDKYNKAVVAWEQGGSGVVCGLETKQYGISEQARGGGFEDWEPGYFTGYGQVKLYVVRWRLESRDFAYVPPWAIQPIAHAETT